jgi:hypothetical protein
MFTSLRQNFSAATLAQLAAELLWLFVAGALVMAYNMVMTARASRIERAVLEAKLAAKLAKA